MCRSPKHFREADISGGDCHLTRRCMSDDPKGKMIVTQATRSADVEELRRRGMAKPIPPPRPTHRAGELRH